MKAAAPTITTAAAARPERGAQAALALGVAVVFAALVVAYFFAFRAASAAQIKEVPLQATGGRP